MSPSFFPLGWSTSYSVPRASLTEPHKPLLIIAIPACLSFHKPNRSKSPKDKTESLGDNYSLPGRLSLLGLLSGHVSHDNLHPVTCVYVNGFLDHKHTQAWVWAWSPGLRAKEHTRILVGGGDKKLKTYYLNLKPGLHGVHFRSKWRPEFGVLISLFCTFFLFLCIQTRIRKVGYKDKTASKLSNCAMRSASFRKCLQ